MLNKCNNLEVSLIKWEVMKKEKLSQISQSSAVISKCKQTAGL